MKVLSLFSGIGAFEKALDNLQIPYELAGFSEIDKYAVKSYCAIHGVDESMNLGDITKIDEKVLPKDIDLITYGFPCQDISLAGKQKGLFHDDGSKTRSGLFFEALRIIEATKPRIAIAENVKNLTGKKFKEQFQIVLESLEAAGYNNYWKVLNAKDYGIPQNRERVFIISIRKDIDKGYEFPKPFPLQLRLKDMLEDEVDEKFYLDSMKKYFIKHSFESEEKGNGFRFTPHVKKNANVAKTVTTRAGGRMDDNFVMDVECEEDTFKFDSTNKMIQVGQMYGTDKEHKCVPVEPVRLGNIYGEKFGTGYAGNVWDKECISPTLMTMQGGNRQPLVIDEGVKAGNTSPSGNYNPSVIVREATKKGYAEAVEGDSINLEQPNTKGLCNTLTTVQKDNYVAEPKQSNLRIRKLTPKECFRLMGFDDEDFYKAEAVNSNTQLYKQAGNSIVVDVLEAIFTNLKPYLSERK